MQDRSRVLRSAGANGDAAGSLFRNPARCAARIALVCAAVFLAGIAPVARMRAQEGHLGMPLVTDWSHQHVIYSAPKLPSDAYRLQYDVRYIQQWLRRSAATSQPAVFAVDGFPHRFPRPTPKPEPEATLRPDWGFSVPGPGNTALDGVYPAKYSFSVTGAPSCANDFVVMPTGVAGSTTTIFAAATGSFSAQPTSGSVITITNGANTLTVTAGAGTNPYAIGATTTATATNLATDITSNGGTVGVTASSNGPTVTITAKTAGSAANSTTLSAGATTNFTWGGAASSSLQGGADGTASIAAVNNLYAGPNGACTGPTAYWNYNTGGTITTSPIFSLDGSQVAFVQTNGGVASLVVLKWSASATFATLTSNASYPNCTAPCMISLTFSGSQNDTGSSPFVSYGRDTLYVGDNSGKLHKFTPVFGGTPAEAGSPWPLTVSTAATPDLSSPVYDSGSGNLFVGDTSGNLWYVRETGSSTTLGGSCSAGNPPCVGSSHLSLGGAITDGPILDVTNETVYAFDGTTNGMIGAGSAASTYSMVVQTDTSLTLLNGPNGTVFQNSSTAILVPPMHAGALDNAYYSSGKGSGKGKLYVCAPTTTGHDYRALFRIGFTAAGHGAWGTINVLNTAADTGDFQFTANTSGGSCSTLTEIYNSNANTPTDWLFLSLGNYSAGPGTTGTTCGGVGAGCILSMNLTTVESNTWPPASFTSPAGWISGDPMPAGPTYANGRYAPPTGGIIVDNIASTAGAGNAQYSNIYFLSLPNAANPGTTATYTMCNGVVSSGGCTVKLTQSGLN